MSEDNNIVADPQERAYLEKVKAKANAELDRVNSRVRDQYLDLMSLKRYLTESKADMDHVEKVAVRQSVDEMGAIGQHTALGSAQLSKILKSAYFGRIDFRRSGNARSTPVYIGIHSFHDAEEEIHLVHDWRAPISSMFYDFESGSAHYDAPSGRVTGDIDLKRQYRIENGELVFMLESSLNIHDDVLQKELSRASDEKMKNIVATIQRDQNAIIRNDHSHALIIQGAAGSGKTSIALHRIAFLLYRFKDTIRSSDILIISPNKVFAHYISNVLPELGEENIRETTAEALASDLLDDKIHFQSFCDQVAGLFDPKDRNYRERIRYKASQMFLDRLDAYILHLKNNNSSVSDIQAGRFTIPAEFIARRLARMGSAPIAQQINELVLAIADELDREHMHEIKTDERNEVRKQLKAMFAETAIEALYKRFFAWDNTPRMFKFSERGVYEYCDVYPLIYFKMQMEGTATFENVKHLVIDEMQDYTPVQYAVFAQLFPCKKTVLGDANQSVNPLSSSTAESINRTLTGADRVYMNKSYRSTLEISNLAQRIHRNERLVPIERHGEEPVFVCASNAKAELDAIRRAVSRFMDSPFRTLGIVCKTQAQATQVYEYVKDISEDTSLLDPTSTTFNEGITISTAHLAKGLEFDDVILPFCDDHNYQSEVDQHMLYVGCTRAMHRLTVTHTGNRTRFMRE